MTILFPQKMPHQAIGVQSQSRRIGILMVSYNAVTTLTKVLKRIPPDVWAAVEEVAVFDDASSDDTHELALGYKATSGLEKLTVFKNSRRLGYGGNQKRGYQYFIDRDFDIVILLHSDGQYAPEVLADLYMPLVRGEADAVFGSRMMSGYSEPLKNGMPLYKFIGNKILTPIENRMLGMKLTEFHSGYRAYTVDTLKQIDFTKMTDDFHFDTEITIKLNHQGFRVKEVPIPTYHGGEIHYLNGIKYSFNVLRAVIRYNRTLQGFAKYPEYSEFFVHYPLKESKYSSHYIFAQLVGNHNDVLDIGCGEGFFAAKIAGAANRITGVDLLARPQQISALQKYIVADLDGGLAGVPDKLAGQRFDKILLQDVLEHLRRPETVLRDCAVLLKPRGQILVSVPNIANITVRLSLLFGRFQYTERGITDRTHLRFFTRKSIRSLLEENGYEVVRTTMSVMPLEIVWGLSLEHPVMRVASPLLATLTRLMPGLFGYQCIIVVRRKLDD